MKPQTLWQISVTTTREAEEATTELLATVSGQTATSYEDLDLGTCTPSVYLEAKPASWIAMRKELVAGIKRIRACGLNPDPVRIAFRKLGRRNWMESWKRHFKPLRFGTTLLIRPTWSRVRPVRGQSEVVLDPGLSFGTGQHPTTAFCVEHVVNARKPEGPSFLDVGTGSGILAICAAKLRFRPVVAFDNDPDAVRVAAKNARRNRVLDRIQLRQGDVATMSLKPRLQYDLVCANLIANLLLEHRDRLLAALRPGGTLVLAGILATEFAKVKSAFEERGAQLLATRTEKEWQSGAFRVGAP